MHILSGTYVYQSTQDIEAFETKWNQDNPFIHVREITNVYSQTCVYRSPFELYRVLNFIYVPMCMIFAGDTLK